MKLREFNNMYAINVKENGLYDKDFTEIIKIGNYGIETTGNDNYFFAGDFIDNPTITDGLKNVEYMIKMELLKQKKVMIFLTQVVSMI